MKEKSLKNIAKNFNKLMNNKTMEMSPKELARNADIGYSTLAPILKGSRDFGVTKLILLAEALNVTPNDILQGSFKEPLPQDNNSHKHNPKYLISFITNARLTRCKIYDIENKIEHSKVFGFSLFCGEQTHLTIEKIKSAIVSMCEDNLNFHDVYVYASVLGYEHIDGREKLKDHGSREFGIFLIEPDWMAFYHSIFPMKNGILITVNDGYVISYSTDHGKTIDKMQGYYFPISDDAGNAWLGCEAIKHAINVYEGLEERTQLSDKILSLVNSDLNLWATKVYDKPIETFLESAIILKELAYSREKQSHILVKKSFDNLWQRVKVIDNKVGLALPIAFAGELAYLYEEFVPKNRLIKMDFVNENECFNYSTKLLKKAIQST